MGCTTERSPVRLAGFLALAGLLFGRLYGGQYQVLLVAVAALPLLFVLTLAAAAAERRRAGADAAGHLLDRIRTHARGAAARAAARDGIVIDVLVGTFLGDTGAYLGGRLFGRRPLAPGSRRTRPSRVW